MSQNTQIISRAYNVDGIEGVVLKIHQINHTTYTYEELSSIYSYLEGLMLFNSKYRNTYTVDPVNVESLFFHDIDTNEPIGIENLLFRDTNIDGISEKTFGQCDFVGRFNIRAVPYSRGHRSDGSLARDLWGHSSDAVFSSEEFNKKIAQYIVNNGRKHHSFPNSNLIAKQERLYRSNFLQLCKENGNIDCCEYDESERIFIVDSLIVAEQDYSRCKYILGKSFSLITVKNFDETIEDLTRTWDEKIDMIALYLRLAGIFHIGVFENIFRNKPCDYKTSYNRARYTVNFFEPYLHCSVRRLCVDPIALRELHENKRGVFYEDLRLTPIPQIDPDKLKPGNAIYPFVEAKKKDEDVEATDITRIDRQRQKEGME